MSADTTQTQPGSKYDRLNCGGEGRAANADHRGASLRRDLAARCHRQRKRRHYPARAGRARAEDQGYRRPVRSRCVRLRDRRCRAQRRIRGQGRRAHPCRQRRAADEGQPAHRRIDARRHGQDRWPAHRPAHQPCLRDGCAGLCRDHLRDGCGDQHLPRSRRQTRHHPERDRPLQPGRLRQDAAGGDPVRGRDRDLEDPVDDRSRGPVQDGRSRPDHRRHARRPAGLRQCHRSGSRADQGHHSPRSPAGRRSWSFRTSSPATCWPRTSPISPRPMAPASCSVRACRSS